MGTRIYYITSYLYVFLLEAIRIDVRHVKGEIMSHGFSCGSRCRARHSGSSLSRRASGLVFAPWPLHLRAVFRGIIIM
jgi:hypothetical protein